MKKLLLAFPLIMLLSCQINKGTKENGSSGAKDPHTYAEPLLAKVEHLDLDLNVDFAKKQLRGKASWQIVNPGQGEVIILDTRNLNVSKVTADDQPTTFELGKEEKFLGQPLRIKIRPNTSKITVWYTTSATAAALQWLTPQQTAGKKRPFLFTQSEAILARTWIPCQDSPAIRFTYNATVTVPKDLLALMSAENPIEKNSQGSYQFKQRHPIPSYLMALAVGDLAFQKVDNRTGVYAEPVTIKKAAWEFADMGKMVDAAEKLSGPYQWGRYDVLVLPPSFPFGGMENPMLTFATPTVIAGDRSLVSLIAHELAHSWSGNLATNATWNDFWLNEGFTTYFERRIVEEVYGKDDAKMQEFLGRQDLFKSVEEYGPTNPDTRLKTDFTGRDPDEGVSDIAYEKGYSFLRTIEEAVGRQKFDQFVKGYFSSHAFQSVTTEEFLDYLNKELIKDNRKLSERINVNAWVYEPGIPQNIPPVDAPSFKEIDRLLDTYLKTGDIARLKNREYNTNEFIYLIRKLPSGIKPAQLGQLDDAFHFTASGNSEVQTAWYSVAIRERYTKAYPYIEAFLTQVGRRKFLMPLYSEMIKTAEGKQWAQKIYKKARPNYHSVAYNSLDELLK